MGLISYLHASSANSRSRAVGHVVEDLAQGAAELAAYVEMLEERIADLERRVDELES